MPVPAISAVPLGETGSLAAGEVASRVLETARRAASRFPDLDREEIAQQTAVAFLQKPGAIEQPADWAARVAFRLAHRQLRDRRREQRRQPPPGPGSSDEPSAPPPPLTPDQRLDLARAVARLPARQRALVRLHLQGHTGPEIAARLGLTPRSTSTLLARAIRRMRRAVGGPNPSSAATGVQLRNRSS